MEQKHSPTVKAEWNSSFLSGKIAIYDIEYKKRVGITARSPVAKKRWGARAYTRMVGHPCTNPSASVGQNRGAIYTYTYFQPGP